MSEHSIEELERQVQQADDRAKEANQRASDARRRLMDAKLEATGFKGCIAEFDEQQGYGRNRKTVTRQFRVERIGRWGGTIEGTVIKADGTLGVMTKRCEASRARNLGPYKASEAAE